MKKNILIISYGYPPNNVAGAQRPFAIAKYLDKTKFNVKVLTCENPEYPLGKNDNFDNCIVGAGSVVTKNIPANSIAVGNPCRVIKTNN